MSESWSRNLFKHCAACLMSVKEALKIGAAFFSADT
jgi:hypothetical protein